MKEFKITANFAKGLWWIILSIAYDITVIAINGTFSIAALIVNVVFRMISLRYGFKAQKEYEAMPSE